MENIIIRRAETADVYKIADIKIEGWQTAYRGIVDDKFLDSMDRENEIEKRRKNIESGVDIIVAEYEGEVVGYCMYRNYNQDVKNYPDVDCEVSALYVTSHLKRNGIGRKLMLHVIEILKSKGKKKMILGCLKDNFPSRTFYEKMGGKVVKYTEIEFGEKKYSLVMYEFDIYKM